MSAVSCALGLLFAVSCSGLSAVAVSPHRIHVSPLFYINQVSSCHWVLPHQNNVAVAMTFPFEFCSVTWSHLEDLTTHDAWDEWLRVRRFEFLPHTQQWRHRCCDDTLFLGDGWRSVPYHRSSHPNLELKPELRMPLVSILFHKIAKYQGLIPFLFACHLHPKPGFLAKMGKQSWFDPGAIHAESSSTLFVGRRRPKQYLWSALPPGTIWRLCQESLARELCFTRLV